MWQVGNELTANQKAALSIWTNQRPALSQMTPQTETDLSSAGEVSRVLTKRYYVWLGICKAMNSLSLFFYICYGIGLIYRNIKQQASVEKKTHSP